MWKRCVLLWGLLAGVFLSSNALAQNALAQDPNVIYFQHRQFKIPFKNDQKGLNVTLVKLYASSNQGQNWQLMASAAPTDQHFRFSTPHDGYFWFAVQTIDNTGKAHPPQDRLDPSLKVVVDTLPPSVQVQPLQPRGNEVGVSWLVRDDNFDPNLFNAVQVEYRVGNGQWIPINVPQGSNQVYWNPSTNAQIEVRVSARDRAGNIGEEKTSVSLQGNAGGGVNPFQGGGAIQQPFDEARNLPRKFVNSKLISLGYNVKDVGPSGVSTIELWATPHKGRQWKKIAEFSGEAKEEKRLTFEVQEEGVYGITLLAKSGVGLGERPPQLGEAPQLWLEVDTTKPVVQLLGVHVGTGADKGKLAVAWTAQDKNLSRTPIRLSYAEQKDGPWTTVADKLGNSGKHIWNMPPDLPFQFYLRVEAIDEAGNVGEAITSDRVKVDLSQPKAVPLDITPAGR